MAAFTYENRPLSEITHENSRGGAKMQSPFFEKRPFILGERGATQATRSKLEEVGL